MFDAFYVSLVIFFVSYGAYYGTNVGHYEFGTTLLTTHLAVMFLNLAVVTKSCVCNQKLQKDLNNNSPHLGYRLHSK